MVCGECGYRFVLSPKQAPFCSDHRFVRCVEEVSADKQRAYTAHQLHGAIAQRRNRGFWHRIVPARGSSDLEATARAIQQWRDRHRELGPILERPALADAHARWPEPDLFDYGAEGVLAVDDPLLVDFLVRNRVHTATKVAILDGRDGYPEPLVARLAPLVEARPDLPIFLLHDSRGGAAAALELSTRDLLGASDHPVVDLGLPGDAAKRIPEMRWARRLPVVAADMLPRRWLTSGIAAAIGHRMPLIALLEPRPEGDDAADDGLWWVAWSDGDQDFG
jgi:hypothetical protein